MNKVVVFGGAGFLGSHVADELTKNGYDVTIFDIRKSSYLANGQKMVVGNILDRNMVRDVVQDAKYVYHFAAMADIHEAIEKPIEAAQFNILGTMYILDACREFKVERFVFSSTIYVYSDHGSFYRSSKQACELFIENYYKEFNLNFTILRYGSLYGPRANRFNFIRNTIENALMNRRIDRQGDGAEVRDYINVIDAAQLSVKALDKTYCNEYVMITGPQTMKVRELLAMINEMLDNKISINYNKGEHVGHYQITPYSFRPKVAVKMVPSHYHDLGQGLLEMLYETYKELVNDQKIDSSTFKKPS